jgi:DNA polymerase-3 subunit alpha
MSDRLAIVFDTETTGLVKNSARPLEKQPHVIEFCGLLVKDDGSIVGELEFLCKPPVPITEEITKITGIKPEDVEGKPPFSEYVERINDIFGVASVVVAHNLSFDLDMMRNEFRRANAEFSEPPEGICTVEATEWLKGYRLNLSALHEHLFGTPFSGAHRARTDTEALTRCWAELNQRGII